MLIRIRDELANTDRFLDDEAWTSTITWSPGKPGLALRVELKLTPGMSHEYQAMSPVAAALAWWLTEGRSVPSAPYHKGRARDVVAEYEAHLAATRGPEDERVGCGAGEGVARG